MKAGELNKKIKILALEGEQSDGAGGVIPGGWATVAEPWAKVTPVAGPRTAEAAQEKLKPTNKFTFRNIPGRPLAGDRIEYEGRLYGIAYMVENRDRTTTVTAVATQ